MQISGKAIIRVAAVIVALTTIGGVAVAAIKIAGPISESGPLPVPSRAELNEQIAGLTQALKGLQAQQVEQARQDAARDRLLAATRQQELEGLLFSAQAQMPKNMATRAYICNLIDQIDQVRAVNHLAPMPPCH